MSCRAALITLMVLLTLGISRGYAASAEVIDDKVSQALAVFSREVPAAAQLLAAASGVLVFPEVMKMGFGIGGEYGEGALLVDDQGAGYFATAGASFGLQMGAESKTQVILFMDPRVLRKFRRSNGWEAGVDGTITAATLASDGGLDPAIAEQPIIGFMFSNRGQMYNLTLEGTKITRIKR
jgi:lipid-binding SYLF domain-containing protein